MSRSKLIVFTLLVAVLGWSFLPTDLTKASQWKEPVQRDSQQKVGESVIKKREFQFADNDKYWMRQITAEENGQPHRFTIPINQNYATFRYRDLTEDNQPYWKVINLRDVSELPVTPGFIESPGTYLWIGEPVVYKELGRGTIETLPEEVLPIEVSQTPNGLQLEVRLPQVENSVSEIWALESREPIVHWADQSTELAWLRLDLTRNAKWLYNGYYYKSPTTYDPTAENGFWRIPENYVAASLLQMDGSEAADKMAYVMLRTSLEQQEQEGYWKTLPRSEWLWEDYGIEEGFYDTRFNTGAALQMLRGCIQYDDERFCESARRYADFFHDYARDNHYVVEGERPGWLVADYTGPNEHADTHVSLNHQLAELNFLYRFYSRFGREIDRELADLMLTGVVNLGEKWVRENGDLHYAYFPDGSFDRPDYPYLTYNDLLETQELYQELYGAEEATIARLLESKRNWMIRNNVSNR
ncbi:hypothetical protein ACAF76_004895 [Brevibacillus sp. TJ4]|uniref:hypothetical protein n=1 Tax=Brevibacillus sp. TJ4 TaxID=3234853 RepID=UPI0037D95996